MILYELVGTETNPVYQELEISNAGRQYDFLRSLVQAALSLNKPLLSQTVIKALNFHAIGCLHTNAGEYRPCEVSVGSIKPPEQHRVQAAMDDFVNVINRFWDAHDPITLAAHVLWRLNWIHPFINGNGRTARAACYYVLCLRAGGLIPGSPMLPELITLNRTEYVDRLRMVDASLVAGVLDFTPLSDLLTRLVAQQLASAPTAPVQP